MRTFPALGVLILSLAGCQCGPNGPGGGAGGGSDPAGGGTEQTGGGSGGGASGTGGGTTGCGPCNTPPTACHGQGSCVNGQCEYPFVDGATCDDGNACTVGDTCRNNGCSGTPKVCDAPPAAMCTSSTQLLSYDAMGSCQAGLCVYASHSTACASGGCRNNACATDVCGSITCNTPPSACFAATGSCSNGQCSYAFANGVTCDDGDACTSGDSCSSGVCQGAPMACNAPPANVCTSATTLRSYQSSGTCSLGACAYPSTLITCTNGCANGACTGSGWSKLTTGTIQDLYAVWGSSPSAVWAGGAYGTMLFFNGTSWASRVSSTTQHIWSISGSGASDVFAATDGSTKQELIHFDGTAWAQVPVTLGLQWDYYGSSCVAALGGQVALFAMVEARSMGTSYTPVRAVYKVQRSGTTWSNTLVGEFSIPTGNTSDSCGISLLGANSFVVAGGATTMLWNGSAFVQLGATSAANSGVYALSATSALGVNRGNVVQVLSGTTWGPANVGFGATAVHGTSGSRAFVVGGTGPYSGPYSPRITVWDGLGFTAATLPSTATNAGYLNAVWASSTGDVFAVGDDGLALRGP